MPTVRYTTIDNEIVAEKRDGERKAYVPDSQGSTVALLDNQQHKTDTFDYWPYGEERNRTGVNPTPFQFTGTHGYHRSKQGLYYVRARYFNNGTGVWHSKDPLCERSPDLNHYRYVYNRPVSMIDPTGLDYACSGLGGSFGQTPIIGYALGCQWFICHDLRKCDRSYRIFRSCCFSLCLGLELHTSVDGSACYIKGNDPCSGLGGRGGTFNPPSGFPGVGVTPGKRWAGCLNVSAGGSTGASICHSWCSCEENEGVTPPGLKNWSPPHYGPVRY